MLSIHETEVNTVADKAVEIIRNQILSGILISGEKLKHSVLAKEFRMSATPIREALSRLEKHKLVEHVARKGWIVRKVSKKEAKQIYEVREYIEGLNVRLVCEIANNEILNEIRKEYDVFDYNLNNGDLNGCLISDMNFHKLLAIKSGNKFAFDILDDLFDLICVIRRNEIDIDSLYNTQKDHMEIIEAIASKKPEIAEQAVRNHIRGCHEMIDQRLSD